MVGSYSPSLPITSTNTAQNFKRIYMYCKLAALYCKVFEGALF